MTVSAAAAEIDKGLVLAISGGLILGSLGLFFWGFRRQSRTRRSINLLLWGFFSAGLVSLIFSLFPGSTAEGELAGFTLTGAFAAFAVFWWLGAHLSAKAIAADEDAEALNAKLAELSREIKRRDDEAAIAKPRAEDPVLPLQQDVRYEMRRGKRAKLVILTGDLLQVQQADVWVSPENTNMQPSRYHDRSVSAMIRYSAAERNAAGAAAHDVIGEALVAAMSDRGTPELEQGMVVATDPGALGPANRVKRIFHVAAVSGSPYGGYRPIARIEDCAKNALARMDSADEEPYGLTTIVFPMLATGVAGAKPEDIAPRLLSAVVSYLQQHKDSRVKCVYLLAYRQSELLCWMHAADHCDLLKPAGGSLPRAGLSLTEELPAESNR